MLEKLPAQLHHNRDDTTHKIKELASVGAEGDGYVIQCFDKNVRPQSVLALVPVPVSKPAL